MTEKTTTQQPLGCLPCIRILWRRSSHGIRLFTTQSLSAQTYTCTNTTVARTHPCHRYDIIFYVFVIPAPFCQRISGFQLLSPAQ